MRETVTLLTTIGETGDGALLSGTAPPGGYISRLGWEPWQQVGRDLASRQLLSLAKGLHLAAEQDLRWYGGSVTPIKAVLGSLEARGEGHLIVLFALWAAQRRRLYYGEYDWAAVIARRHPAFGTLTEDDQRSLTRRMRRVLSRVARWEPQRRQRSQQHRETSEEAAGQRRRRWKSEPYERAIAYEIQRAQQKLPRSTRAAELAQLEVLSPAARLARIARDDDRTVMYFPGAFAQVDDLVLADLDPEVAELLFLKARFVRQGHWKKLQHRLVELGLVVG